MDRETDSSDSIDDPQPPELKFIARNEKPKPKPKPKPNPKPKYVLNQNLNTETSTDTRNVSPQPLSLDVSQNEAQKEALDEARSLLGNELQFNQNENENAQTEKMVKRGTQLDQERGKDQMRESQPISINVLSRLEGPSVPPKKRKPNLLGVYKLEENLNKETNTDFGDEFPEHLNKETYTDFHEPNLLAKSDELFKSVENLDQESKMDIWRDTQSISIIESEKMFTPISSGVYKLNENLNRETNTDIADETPLLQDQTQVDTADLPEKLEKETITDFDRYPAMTRSRNRAIDYSNVPTAGDYAIYRRERYDPDPRIDCPGWNNLHDNKLLILYHLAFYLVLGLFFSSLLYCYFLLLPTDRPLNGPSSPGLSYAPLPFGLNDKVIQYIENNVSDVRKFVNQIDKFLGQYGTKGRERFVNCDLDGFYGYTQHTPCIFIKLNRVFNFEAKTYNEGISLPGAAPYELYKFLSKKITGTYDNRIWLSCNITNPKVPTSIQYVPERFFDAESMLNPPQLSPDSYERKGMNYYDNMDYRRIIGVKLYDLPLDEKLTLRCSVWAKNIEVDEQIQGQGNLKIFMKIERTKNHKDKENKEGLN